MAVPAKYRRLTSFADYFSGKKVAPVLTIFVGGNHEASSHLSALPYGGWVAQNIFYLGWAGVVNYGGLRIGGISGIYKSHDFEKGHFEKKPFDEGTVRSIYHQRHWDTYRLALLDPSTKLDIFISHDWPCGITKFGDEGLLLQSKPFFADDIARNQLGSPALSTLLRVLQPKYWFAGHLHVKFAALVRHDSDNQVLTKFLALDKCESRRHYLQFVEFPAVSTGAAHELQFDEEWMKIVKLTHPSLPDAKICSQSAYAVQKEDVAQMAMTLLPSALCVPPLTMPELQTLQILENLQLVAPAGDIGTCTSLGAPNEEEIEIDLDMD
jgi:lariat debranching enzyme